MVAKLLPIDVPAESKTCPLPVGGQVFCFVYNPLHTGKLS
jgi:hypothetical protein